MYHLNAATEHVRHKLLTMETRSSFGSFEDMNGGSKETFTSQKGTLCITTPMYSCMGVLVCMHDQTELQDGYR